jgi:Spy/CpxP family protein refolding chaperone
MKRLSGVVLACAVLAGLGSRALVSAQGGPGEWKERLGLSDEQQAKLKAAHRAQRDAVTPLHDKMEDELDKLRGLVKEGKDEKAVAASLETVKSLHKSLQVEEEKFRVAAAAVLSPLQQAKMLLAMMGHMRPGGPHGGPRMHGRGGHGEHGGPGGGPGMHEKDGQGDKDGEDDEDDAR